MPNILEEAYGWLYNWWGGEQPEDRPKQHVFRRQGEVEEDPVSYKPGFWEGTAKPFAKTVMFIVVAGSAVTLAIGGINAGCGYRNKADTIAAQARADTENREPCKSSIVTRKGSDNLDTKCTHSDHVLRTQWERGELTVQCLCPNTIADEKNRGVTSEQDVGEEE